MSKDEFATRILSKECSELQGNSRAPRPVGRRKASDEALLGTTGVDTSSLLLPGAAYLQSKYFRTPRVLAKLKNVVGRGGLEPPTSRLSGVRSNHLSYRPMILTPQCNVMSGGA